MSRRLDHVVGGPRRWYIHRILYRKCGGGVNADPF